MNWLSHSVKILFAFSQIQDRWRLTKHWPSQQMLRAHCSQMCLYLLLSSFCLTYHPKWQSLCLVLRTFFHLSPQTPPLIPFDSFLRLRHTSSRPCKIKSNSTTPYIHLTLQKRVIDSHLGSLPTGLAFWRFVWAEGGGQTSNPSCKVGSGA
jgi:hypothetical protein